MKYQLPPKLKVGDGIAVIAPCSAADPDKVEDGLDYLSDRGFVVKRADNLSTADGYLAGSDEERLNSFMDFWKDPEINALFCVRGGYGIQRLLNHLDYDLISSNPKILVGYSDISALSAALLAKSGVVTYSGPMVASDMGGNFDNFSEEMLWRTLMGRPSIANPKNQSLLVFRKGQAAGNIIGGTLTVLLPYFGTSYMPDLEGAILVLEDIGENPGRLDRHFHHLRYQGVFDKISGLVLGEFKDCFPDDADQFEGFKPILESALKGYNFPVVMNFAFGHIDTRVTLPIGARAKLTTDPSQFSLV